MSVRVLKTATLAIALLTLTASPAMACFTGDHYVSMLRAEKPIDSWKALMSSSLSNGVELFEVETASLKETAHWGRKPGESTWFAEVDTAQPLQGDKLPAHITIRPVGWTSCNSYLPLDLADKPKTVWLLGIVAKDEWPTDTSPRQITVIPLPPPSRSERRKLLQP